MRPERSLAAIAAKSNAMAKITIVNNHVINAMLF